MLRSLRSWLQCQRIDDKAIILDFAGHGSLADGVTEAMTPVSIPVIIDARPGHPVCPAAESHGEITARSGHPQLTLTAGDLQRDPGFQLRGTEFCCFLLRAVEGKDDTIKQKCCNENPGELIHARAGLNKFQGGVPGKPAKCQTT